jgi:hypothetical protein
MELNKIENFSAIASKLKTGSLEYCLWTDANGALYVQIVRNRTNTQKPGTHSKLLFRVSAYLNDRYLENELPVIRGINPETFREETSENNDDSGFIKAILRHLLP